MYVSGNWLNYNRKLQSLVEPFNTVTLIAFDYIMLLLSEHKEIKEHQFNKTFRKYLNSVIEINIHIFHMCGIEPQT